MKTIDSYLTEKLKINKDIVSNAPVYNYYPKDKYKLKSLLRKLLKERGENADLNDIDVAEITDMSNLFSGLSPSNIDISKWDVSNVKNMEYMFFECKKFNSDLSAWNVSSVTNMSNMFYNCRKFNSNLRKWNVSSVTDMEDMFDCCNSLKKIPNWYHD